MTREEAVVTATKRGFDGWAGDLWTFLHTNPVAWRLYGWLCWGAHLPRVERWVDERLRATSADTVLDVPVGTGRLTPLYSSTLRPRRLIVVDIADAMVQRARQALSETSLNNVEYHVADVAGLPVESGSVDLVVSEGGFHHFPNRSVAASELARVSTRPGRIVGYTLIDGGSPQGDFSFRMFHRRALMGSPLSEARLRGALESVGFSQLETRRFGSVLAFDARVGNERAH